MSNYKRNEENKTNNNNSGVYCIRNKTNNKRYVGQTYDIPYRWNRHKFDLNHGYHSNKHLQSSWNKYGEENFEFIVLEYCNMEELDEREIYWIDYYDCFNKGYNLAEGGIGCRGYKHTDEEIEKMRMIQNPKPILQYDKNGTFIKEWISCSQASKELGIYNLGIYNCCKRINHVKSAGGFIWVYKDDGFDVDYYLTVNTQKPKSVSQYTFDLKLVKVWDSAWQASKNGFSSSQISNVCNGKIRSHSGFYWKFTGEDWIYPEEYYLNRVKNAGAEKTKRKVIQYDLDKNIIRIWDSMKEATLNGFNKNSIRKACINNSIYKNYMWNYYDEYIKQNNEINESNFAECEVAFSM